MLMCNQYYHEYIFIIYYLFGITNIAISYYKDD
jgi:hypothetical protein